MLLSQTLTVLMYYHMNRLFERIMLCVIAAGVWTIAGLYIYEFVNVKDVYADIDQPVEVKVVNEVDAYILN